MTEITLENGTSIVVTHDGLLIKGNASVKIGDTFVTMAKNDKKFSLMEVSKDCFKSYAGDIGQEVQGRVGVLTYAQKGETVVYNPNKKKENSDDKKSNQSNGVWIPQ